ncbi:MAG TPA: hypothetical protein VHV51_20435 [Polyangiaceae bacterium]|nr:hypothetical protein [Polyangiaceae bacterium]
MQRFITLVCAVSAVAFAVVACGSSDDSSGSSNNGGSAGSSSVTQCVGAFSTLTENALSAQTASAGKCASKSDVASICSNDVNSAAETCGTSCFPMSGDQDACVSQCLNSMVLPVLSDACVSCYVADVGCARTHCAVQCVGDASGKVCMSCRQDAGCIDAFYDCTGLPNPAGNTSGGSGGSGGGSAAGSGGDSSIGAGGEANGGMGG